VANFSDDKSALDALRSQHDALLAEVGKVIVGQDEVIREVTTAIFAGGHILLVGVPGLAKTLLVNTVAQALGLSFKVEKDSVSEAWQKATTNVFVADVKSAIEHGSGF